MNNKLLKCIIWVCVLTVLLILISFFSLTIGTVSIPFKKILFLLMGNEAGTMEHSILFNIRLPRIILAIAIGGALSLSGVLLQSIFRNPLVEPYTLGISGGAALAVSINIVFKINQLSTFSMPIAGFLGAMVVILLTYILSSKRSALKTQDVLLTGVMISFICSSLVMLLMAIARAEDLHGIVFWIMGSLEQPDWILIKFMAAASLLGLIISYKFCSAMNALALGEEEARHLGIDTTKLKWSLFSLASLLTGFSVALAGVIGFVGLVIPHFVRLFISSDYRIVLASSFLFGGSFLVLCDTCARTVISPVELPVGVITGIVGGSLFIYGLTKRRVKV